MTDKGKNEILESKQKLTFLKRAFIEEQKKKTELEAELTQLKEKVDTLEKSNEEREKENVELTRENTELRTAIVDMRNSKKGDEKIGTDSNTNVVTNFFGKILQKEEEQPQATNEEDKQKIVQLTKRIQELENDNDFLKKKQEAMRNDCESIKLDYNKRIEELNNEIIQNQLDVVDKDRQRSYDIERIEVMTASLNVYEKEKEKYETQIMLSNKTNKDLQKDIADLKLQIASKTEQLTKWQKDIQKYSKENFQLCIKLRQYKYGMVNETRAIHSFLCEKVGSVSNSKLKITFGMTDDDEYVFIYQEDKKQPVQINIESIEYMRISDSDPKIIDVSILNNAKYQRFKIKSDIEQCTEIIETFNDYFQSVMRTKNGFNII